jgi:hypothetical protein
VKLGASNLWVIENGFLLLLINFFILNGFYFCPREIEIAKPEPFDIVSSLMQSAADNN